MNNLAKTLLALGLTIAVSKTSFASDIKMEEYWTQDRGYTGVKQKAHEFRIIVEKGDDLISIAKKINKLNQKSSSPFSKKVTWKDIYEWNNKLGGFEINNPNLIHPGQQLVYIISHIPKGYGMHILH